jgi:chorismate mutase
VLGNGLKWLKKAKEETGLLMGTEVANAAHVKLALEYDDIIMGGSQNNGEPFCNARMQMLYKELKNCIGKILLTQIYLYG